MRDKLSDTVWNIMLGNCVILACVSTLAMGYRPQQIIFYKELNFTGEQQIFYESVRDKSLSNYKSHCVVRGLWRITGVFNTNPAIKFMENAYGDEKKGNVCGTWTTKNKTAKYTSIHLIGAQDLDTPSLHLNTKPRFFGQELYFAGTLLRLPEPTKFNSFGFTGKENWTVYKTTDLTGVSECLSANIDPLGDYGVTFNTNKSLVVGSIGRGGCGPNDSFWKKDQLKGERKQQKPSRPSGRPGYGYGYLEADNSV